MSGQFDRDEMNAIFEEALNDLNSKIEEDKEVKWNLIHGMTGPALIMEPYSGFTVKVKLDVNSQLITCSIFHIEDESDCGSVKFSTGRPSARFIASLCFINATALITTYELTLKYIEHDLNLKAIKEKISKAMDEKKDNGDLH